MRDALRETPERLVARYTLAQALAVQAGQRALDLYRRRDALRVEHKGLQDVVSIADREVEAYLRDAIGRHFPQDGVLGEEGEDDRLGAHCLWVVDPIDGTACFLNGLHAWCISIALLVDGEPVLGVVYDPNANELFHAMRGSGAFVGDRPLAVRDAASLRDGVLGVGFSHRVEVDAFAPFLQRVLEAGGMFVRNGSGALMIAYVAAGRLVGYYEPHINAWDCLAGIVLVQEAGGVANAFLQNGGLTRGNPILVAGPGLFPWLADLAGLNESSAALALSATQVPG